MTQDILTASRELANYFEDVIKESVDAKLATNWMIGDVSARLNKEDLGIDQCPVSAHSLAGMLKRIEDKTISGKMAKDVFNGLWENKGSVDDIIDKHGWRTDHRRCCYEALLSMT